MASIGRPKPRLRNWFAVSALDLWARLCLISGNETSEYDVDKKSAQQYDLG